MLLNDYYKNNWLPDASVRLRECTLAGYMSTWNMHIRPVFGDTEISQVNAESVNEWLRVFDKPGAARKAWSFLRSLLRHAAKHGQTVQDFTAVVVPHVPHYEPDVLSPMQVRALLQGFYSHELEAWLICSLCCGLRREEACALEWSDIDLRSGLIHIERGVQWVNGHESINEPKTELSRRTVVLPRFAVKRLRQIKPRTNGRIVGGLTPPQVAKRYQQHCKRNHLPYVPPRNLRHSWATTALHAGVDISVVARQLGHSDIQTTARYYLKPDVDILRSAQKAWEKLIIH